MRHGTDGGVIRRRAARCTVAFLGAGASALTLTRLATAQDPFAPDPRPSGGADAGVAAPGPGPASNSVVDAKCEHITSAVCGKQNTMLLATAGGYVVVTVILVSVWRSWWNKKGTGTASIRLWLPMLLGAATAGLLAGFDPARSEDLKCCLASGVFRPEILLQDSSIGRAFLFGALPAIVLYFLVTLGTGLSKR